MTDEPVHWRIGPGLSIPGTGGGALDGLTVAVKDVIDVAGEPTGVGHPDLVAQARPAQLDADAVAALRRAGATIVGKAHTDELAFSLEGVNAHYGAPVNPAAPERLTGGSSSGCAAAVAGGEADLGLGTDTAGSIRVPASYCGLYSLRPTWGRISLTGVASLAPSLTSVSILARRPEILEAAGSVLLGTDSLAAGHPEPQLVVADDFMAESDPATQNQIEARLAGWAASVTRIDLGAGRLGPWVAALRRRQLFEVWEQYGSWVRSTRPPFGPGVADRMAAAEAASEAPEPLEPWRDEIRSVLAACTGGERVVVIPATPGSAPVRSKRADDAVRSRLLRLTTMASLGGLPVVTIPAARPGHSPVGLCLVGNPGQDEYLLAAAKRLDQVGGARLDGGAALNAPSMPRPGVRMRKKTGNDSFSPNHPSFEPTRGRATERWTVSGARSTNPPGDL